MDMDIEMGDAIEDTTDVQVEELPPADEILSGELDEPGELTEDKPLIGQADDYHESKDVIPTKIHISGVHTLHTDDISAYVKTHFGHVEKIEWIDDDSANLVFNNDYIAGQAITSLSAVQIADVSALTLGESIPAKPPELLYEVGITSCTPSMTQKSEERITTKLDLDTETERSITGGEVINL
ncbi:hypothetical protein E4U38_007019 [Claviceps purpurea]|nr:hypothetical protein E4U38_007019 [Claviceps purpurea]